MKFLEKFKKKELEKPENQKESIGDKEFFYKEILVKSQEIENLFGTLQSSIGDSISNFKNYIKGNYPEEEKLAYEVELKKAIKNSIKSTRKVLWRTTKFLIPLYAAYFGGVNILEKEDGKFSERNRAKIELEKEGITSEQRSVYKIGLSELMYKGVSPFEYDLGEKIKGIPGNIILGRDIETGAATEDAWKLYLGLPQTHNTFGISDYKPDNSKDDKFYFKFNEEKFDFREQLLAGYDGSIGSDDWVKTFKGYLVDIKNQGYTSNEEILAYAKNNMSPEDYNLFVDLVLKGEEYLIRLDFLKYIDNLKSKGGSEVRVGALVRGSLDLDSNNESEIMGHYTVSLGEDEKGHYVSYYDLYNFNVMIEDNNYTKLGHAYEIYNRMYYDPVTGEILGQK